MSPNYKPPRAQVPEQANRVPTQKAPAAPRWNFGFKCWSQQEYFGLECEKVDTHWFVSLITRLKDLGHLTVEDVTSNTKLQDDLRVHPINWNQKGIPVTREQVFELIPRPYRNEETEIMQFQLSKATGRVIGFFDRDYTFQIVFLDPMHHMQPSKIQGYKVTETKILFTEVERLHHQMKEVVHKMQGECPATCAVSGSLSQLIGFDQQKKLFCLHEFLSDDDIKLLLEHHNDLDTVVLTSLLQSLEDAKNKKPA